MQRWKTTTTLSAAFLAACLTFLGFRVHRLWAWEHALEVAVTICRAPCNLDEDGVHTLALAAADTEDPAGELGAMLDELILIEGWYRRNPWAAELSGRAERFAMLAGVLGSDVAAIAQERRPRGMR